MKLKRMIALMAAIMMAFSLAACGNNAEQSSENTATAGQPNGETEDEATTDDSSTDVPDTDEPAAEGTSNILVAYFSKTGNTETIANMIADHTGGDLFKVESTTPYPEDYNETVDIAKEELDGDARPELSSHVEDMSRYDVIYLGYPNWWGTMPMAMFTFLEEYDFTGKTIVPFCTHGGSALGSSEGDIADLVPEAELLEGLAVSGSSVDGAEGDVQSWIDGLGLE